MKAAFLAFALVGFAGSAALAQSYSAPGNDPVRGHTYLGDYPIVYQDGGTICYTTKRGTVKCVPAETFAKKQRR